MKKIILLSTAILLAGVVVGNAGDRKGGVPRNSDGSAAASSDYLGVDYSTAGSATTSDVLVSSGETVFVGLIASSSTALTDHVTFFDSTSTIAAWNNSQDFEAFEVYLSSWTGPAGNIYMQGTSYKAPASVRVKRGLVVRASVSSILRLTTLFNRLTGN